MIEQATIDKIHDTADIVEVVGEFITLKKRGVNYIGSCPFHNEKTPSFTVSPTKGIYKCFGCGAAGNPTKFLMDHEHISYVEALKYLAKKYHIEIEEREETEEDRQAKSDRESLMIVSSFAQKHFVELLHNHEEGKAIGLSYFRSRSISEAMVDKFELGYCLENKTAFTDHALKSGYNIDYLVKSGLTIQKGDWKADRFAGRVMFPIHSISGKVIAFGGRTLKADKKIAKYLNSPESEIYHKSKVLYGIYFAKKTIIQNDQCYLVEGYTDVISLHQAGIENVVASSGTSLTEEQIKLIKRFTSNVTILYDGDFAGIKASMRGIDMFLEQGLNVKVVLFPDGEDPDSYSHKHSATELKTFLEDNEKDFITFKTQLLSEEAEKDPVKRADLINQIVQSIASISDNITRSIYIKECSALMSIEENILYTEIKKRRKIKFKKLYDKESKEAEQNISENKVFDTKIAGKFEYEERAIVRLLLFYGDKNIEEEYDDNDKLISATSLSEFIIKELKAFEEDFHHETYRDIVSAYIKASENGQVLTDKYFTNHENTAIQKIAIDILSDNQPLSKIHQKGGNFIETEDMMLKDLAPKLIFEYMSKVVLVKIDEITKEMFDAEKQGDMDLFMEKQKAFVALTQYKRELSKRLGNRVLL